MASLPTKSFTVLVSDFAASCQGAAATLVDFSVGSVLRAIAEATAGVVLWLQAMVLQVLTLTRASTSSGADLDSWMDDYSFKRLPAVAATGLVTFSHFTPTQAALIPVGATVRTADGSQGFTVTASPSNPAWNGGGYTLTAGTASLTVPVAATISGSAGNAQANAVTVITGAIPGVDTVTNPGSFPSGIDAESDPSFRSRFALYIASLSKGTKAAIASAVQGVRQGLQQTVLENVDATGAVDYGNFLITATDATGYPPTSLLDQISAAVEAVRPITVRFTVLPPTVVTANVSMTITNTPGTSHATVAGNVGVALTQAVNALPLGSTLPYTLLAAIAYSVAGVGNVSAVLLNGATLDIAATPMQKVLAGTVAVA